MRTLWIGFCGERADVRSVLSSALVRELRTRGVNALQVALCQPIKDCLADLGIDDPSQVERTKGPIQSLFGEAIFREAASRRVAEWRDCAMAVVPDLNDTADAQWIRSNGGMLFAITESLPGVTVDLVMTPSETFQAQVATLKQIMDAIWARLQ